AGHPRFQRQELLPRNGPHRAEHALIANAALVELPLHHLRAFRGPIRNHNYPVAIIAGMAHQITLIPGDGIGPEVADATVRAVEATGVEIEWERVDAGVTALARTGQLLPDDVLASLQLTRVGLKGPTATPIAGGHQS